MKFLSKFNRFCSNFLFYFSSLATTNCNQPHSQPRTPLDNGGGGGTEGTDTTNGVEMRDMPGSNRGSKDGTPEEMTELTEHLRRHTSRHCSARDPRISITRHREDITECSSAQLPTWIFNFGPYGQKFNYELLPSPYVFRALK